MDGQNNDAQPSAEASAPDAALETNLSPTPQADVVQEPVGSSAGEGEEAQESGGAESAEAASGGPSGGPAASGSPQENGGAEAPVTPATPVPFDSATQSIGDTAVAPVAPPTPATPAPAADMAPAASAPAKVTPAPADGATGASSGATGASDLVGHVQAALDRDGLGASVTVTQLDATESAALRVLLQSPHRDAVLQAAGALIASSAGGHTWVFIGGAPPDPVNDPEQKSGALLHAVN